LGESCWSQPAQNAKAFFLPLFAKDNGRLAAYYAAISQPDEAHRRFFTHTGARAARFYGLFHNPYETPRPGEKPVGSWLPQFYGQLPLDGGTVRFPGGRGAWSTVPGTDEDILAKLGSPELLIELGRIERERGAPLDEASVKAILRNHADWRPLFDYFRRFDRDWARLEFSALERFTASARGFLSRTGARLRSGSGTPWSTTCPGCAVGALDKEAALARSRACVEVGGNITALRRAGGGSVASDPRAECTNPDDAGRRPAAALQCRPRRFEMARRAFAECSDLARLNVKDDTAVLHALSGIGIRRLAGPRSAPG
jgi:hypothetical protein